MKIQPTTPGHPDGRYQRLMIYIFTNEDWTEPDTLRRYVQGDDHPLQEGFEKAIRGFYRLDGMEEEGRIGPLMRDKTSPATAAYSRELFKGSIAISRGPSPNASMPEP